MKGYRMLDLFSGLGGASQAMLEHPDWDVVRIDNNPLLLPYAPTTQIISMEELMGNLQLYMQNTTVFQDLDLLWASPPCTQFSEAYNAPKSKHRRDPKSSKPYSPDMTLLNLTIELIETVKPRYWIIENVKGAIEFFEPLLGGPKAIIGPYYLWGNFPLFNARLPANYSKENDEDRYGRILRPNARAMVPIEISEACRQSIQYQKSLDDYSVKVKSERSP
jgi:hypothetical protein